MIFKTNRLFIRKFKVTDITAFHNMQHNENVMRYTDSAAKNHTENVADLEFVMDSYQKPNNRFWVWAVVRKEDNVLLGSVALIPYKEAYDEVGFRFDEQYWNNGYGFETLMGLLKYAKSIGKKELFAEVYAKNSASDYILKKAGFVLQKEYLCKETKLIDRLYKITLK